MRRHPSLELVILSASWAFFSNGLRISLDLAKGDRDGGEK
jgi:hypothetical protein